MGLVINLRVWSRRHDAGSGAEVPLSTLSPPKPARASNVTAEIPRARASATKAPQYADGMPPRARQLLTVEAATPRSPATLPVPPSASMTESAFASIDAELLRKLRSGQEFAECEKTISTSHAGICSMRSDPTEMAIRLAATRKALGYEGQTEFCEEIEVGLNTYNPFEKAKRLISLGVAIKIKARFGVPLDWTILGDMAFLPTSISKSYREARPIAEKEFFARTRKKSGKRKVA
jgi:transcriptional regulator with XRE-family HTH domain